MTRYVPIVVVVPESTQRLLEHYANTPEAVAAREPIADLLDRNGWTGEMVVGGSCLVVGIEAVR